jgi:hypothetical protein
LGDERIAHRAAIDGRLRVMFQIALGRHAKQNGSGFISWLPQAAARADGARQAQRGDRLLLPSLAAMRHAPPQGDQCSVGLRLSRIRRPIPRRTGPSLYHAGRSGRWCSRSELHSQPATPPQENVFGRA